MEITVKPTAIKDAVGAVVDGIFMDYSEEAIKAAGVKLKDVVKAVQEDPKFLKALAQRISDSLHEDLVIDCAFDCHSPVLAAVEKKLYKAEQAVDAAKLEQREAERARDAAEHIKKQIRELEALGYKVTKK
jgi:hypothetical protein